MTKKSQTTGQPKRPAAKAYPTPAASEPPKRGIHPPKLMRETHNKKERDAEVQRLVILGTGILVGIAVLILVVALVVDQLVVPRQAVATVNGTNITVGEFQQRVRLERFLLGQQYQNAVNFLSGFGMDQQAILQQINSDPQLSTVYNELTIPDQLGSRVIEDMVEDQLVRQEAAARGITVSEEEVQSQIQDFFGFDPNALVTTPTATVEPTLTPTPLVSPTASPAPTETPAPTATPTADPAAAATDPAEAPTATLTPVPSATPTNTPDATQRAETFNTNRNDFFGALRADAGVGDTEINRYFEQLALREKLRDSLTTELARTTTFYNVRHILVATQEEANDALAALQAGEPFASLAQAVSTDQSNAPQGGELGWAPATNYVEPFAEAVRNAEIGAFVGPVQTEFGWHLIQVRATEERELSEQEYEQAQNRELEQFLEERRSTDNIQVFDTWADNIPSE